MSPETLDKIERQLDRILEMSAGDVYLPNLIGVLRRSIRAAALSSSEPPPAPPTHPEYAAIVRAVEMSSSEPPPEPEPVAWEVGCGHTGENGLTRDRLFFEENEAHDYAMKCDEDFDAPDGTHPVRPLYAAPFAPSSSEPPASGPATDLGQFEGHTPGPWPMVTGGDGKWISIGAACSSWGTDVAEVHRDDIDRNEAEANGRLIAAAPLLLDEVRRLRAALSSAPRTENDNG